MMEQCIREALERAEKESLHERAFLSVNASRKNPEPRDDIRTEFMRDRDRIIHCKSFRRLKHKTQVFFSPTGDHYRTRMTHTLEVAQIGRTIAKALRLNETLTEAIALAHDIGHTPFGHVGEKVLDEKCSKGFRHWEQSLRVVDVLEKDGNGLNLTVQVREGIVKHSKGRGDIILTDPNVLPTTLEAQVVRVADIIAYVNHDIDDALRAGMIRDSDIPRDVTSILGVTHSQRISTLVRSVVTETVKMDYEAVGMGGDVLEALVELREFLFGKVYLSEPVVLEAAKAEKVLKELFDYFIENVECISKRYGDDETSVVDYISGMTDRFALNTYKELFIPKPWEVI